MSCLLPRYLGKKKASSTLSLLNEFFLYMNIQAILRSCHKNEDANHDFDETNISMGNSS
jgi:hypothetical protein